MIQALCVIDLDTVMPGYVHDDFGDAIRTFTNTGEEDDTNLNNVINEYSVFQSICRGISGSDRNHAESCRKRIPGPVGQDITYMQ